MSQDDVTGEHTSADQFRPTLAAPGSPQDDTLTHDTSATPAVGGKLHYIGDYELTVEIARGGMGVVYKARQVSLNRVVEVKMILAGTYASTQSVQRFRAEAEAAANLDHPNILPIYEIGEHDGHQYFSMKLIEGSNLAAEVPRLLKQPRDAAKMMETIARAIHFAHQRGILHRDLKPGNVLLDREGEPVIADFGLAKKMDSQDDQTRTGAVVGTPSYMAPEQARGEKGLTVATDVYSLGAILYELLTGKPPFRTDSAMATIRQVVDVEAPHPRTLNPAADGDLSLIALKCLAKTPASRYASAAELADDLARYLAGEPVRVKAAGPVERSLKWIQRNRVATGVLAASVMVAVGMAWLAWVSSQATRQAEADRAEAEAEARRADSQEKVAIAEAANALVEKTKATSEMLASQRLMDVLRMRSAITTFESNNIIAARVSLRQVRDESRSGAWQFVTRHLERSDWVIPALSLNANVPRPMGYVKNPSSFAAISNVRIQPQGRLLASTSHKYVSIVDPVSGMILHTLAGHTDIVRALAWSPDGRRLASGGKDTVIRIWNVETGQLLKELKGHKQWVYGLAWHSDGRTLLSGGRDEGYRLWNPDTGAILGTVDSPTHNGMGYVAWSPDGKTFLTEGRNRILHLWEVESLKPVREIPSGARLNDEVYWSPDGQFVTCSSNDASIRIWNAATGSQVREITGDLGVILTLAWSPDGRWLACGGTENILRIIEAATGRVVTTHRGHTHPIHAIDWHPDGRHVVTASDDGTVRVWNVIDGQTRPVLRGHGNIVYAAAHSPDGKTILTGSYDKTLRLWNAENQKLIQEYRGHREMVRALAWSPDGRSFVSGGSDGLRIWNVAKAETIRELKGHSGWVNSVDWSRDGTLIASSSLDKTIRIWDAQTGESLHILKDGIGHSDAVAFDPQSRILAEGRNEGMLRLWDVRTGKLEKAFRGHVISINAIAWRGDGQRLATGSIDRDMKLWNVADWSMLVTLPHMDRLISLAWHPDQRTLATACQNKDITLWDTDAQQAVMEWQLPSSPAGRTLAWHPDGRRLICGGGYDFAAYEYAAFPPNATTWLQGHTAWVTKVEMSQDERTVVSTSLNKTLAWDDTRPTGTIPPVSNRLQPFPGDYFYVPAGSLIQRIDKRVSDEELARRKTAWATTGEWHEAQRAAAHQRGDRFAADFHSRRLMKDRRETAPAPRPAVTQ